MVAALILLGLAFAATAFVSAICAINPVDVEDEE